MSIGYAVLVLVRARWLVARNTFWRRKLWQKLLLLLLAVGAGSLSFGLYALVHMSVAFFDSSNELLESDEFRRALQANPELASIEPVALLGAVPSIVLFIATLVLVFSSFSSVLSSLYLSGDMDMLLSKPVPMRAVFIVKFFSGLLIQYALLFILLGPVLFGYGSGMGYGLLYMASVVLVLLLLPLIPIGIGALLVMVVVRVIPAHRAREIVSVLGGLVAVAVYVLSQFAPEVAPRIASEGGIQTLLQVQLPVLPSAWAGEALIAAGEGRPLELVVYGGLFVLLSLLVFGGCLLIAERLYYAGWSNVAIHTNKVRRGSSTGESSAALLSLDVLRPWRSLLRWWGRREPQSAAVFLKDWRVFPRDMRNVQQLIFPLALAVVWIFRLLTLPPQPDGVAANVQSASMNGALVINWLVDLSSIGITFFLCFTLSNAIAGPGISREGRTYWLLKLAPMSELRVLFGKLVLAYLPYPLIGTPVLVLLTVLSPTSPLTFVNHWVVLMLLGLGSTCLSLGLGAAFPRMDWDNPQQQASIVAGCLWLLLSPLYISLVLIAVFGIPALSMLPMVDQSLQAVLGMLGWLVALLLTAGVVWASLYVGEQSLQRLEP